jgi:hypothetical protein
MITAAALLIRLRAVRLVKNKRIRAAKAAYVSVIVGINTNDAAES